MGRFLAQALGLLLGVALPVTAAPGLTAKDNDGIASLYENLKVADDGFVVLCIDGVMRSFDDSVAVVDAFPLSAAQIAKFWDNAPLDVKAEQAGLYDGVDGLGVSQYDLFHPSAAVFANVQEQLDLAEKAVAAERISPGDVFKRQGQNGWPPTHLPSFLLRCVSEYTVQDS
ncbi:hypothetical protein GE09DRAFT_1062121 [Coniochaeta sp. 2T2.1]|nr:hypothetical protein GE09DRAFT_1062121 [Coniochaeta sp. 2T2.1]